MQMFNGKIQLYDLFDCEFMDTALEIYGLTKKNSYPGLQQLLINYRNRLKKSSKFPSFFNLGETYTNRIKINDRNHYVVVWSIAVAKKVIKKYNPPLCKFSLDEIIHLVDQKYINQSYLDIALNNNAPIITASYPPMVTKNKFLIIDGNHRVISKHKDGQKEILGYMFEPHQHIQAIVTEFCRTLFKIHFNYYKIASYIGGVISDIELEKALYPL